MSKYSHIESFHYNLETAKEIIDQSDSKNKEKCITIIHSLTKLESLEEEKTISDAEQKLEELAKLSSKIKNISSKQKERLFMSRAEAEKHLSLAKKEKPKKRKRFKKILGVVGLGWLGLGTYKLSQKGNRQKFKKRIHDFPQNLPKYRNKIKSRTKKTRKGIKDFFRRIFKQKEVIKELETKIERLKKETVPMRFQILKRTKDKITVVIRFYDTKTQRLKKVTKTLTGRSLMIDLTVVKVSNWYIAFPHTIFTEKMKPKDGIEIMSHYDEDGFPSIFNQDWMDKETKNSYKKIFQKVKDDNFKENEDAFGSVVHDEPALNQQFKLNTTYKIISHIKWGVEAVKE